jgi:hypothetical protein
MIPWISLLFVVIAFFVSDLTNLGLFSPHFSQICQGIVNLIYFLKESAFCFIDFFSVYFLVSISLISALIFIISLCQLVLGSACSCFSSNLRYIALGYLFEIFLYF